MPSPRDDQRGARRAQDFLELIERGRRGKLKIYLGSAAGVGKTYRMLQEAQALKAKGVDVVLGFIETHGRAETAALVADLEMVPRKSISYRGMVIEELDLEATLARRPQVVVIDELAHSNVPGERNEKRYEDVLDLVRTGVNVLTAVNIQHLESLNDVVSRMTGIPIRETVPDSMLREADQVVNIDLSVEDLRERLAAGKIYPPEKVQSALGNFFGEANLAALRELALREVAETAEREARIAGAKAQVPAGAPAASATGASRIMLALSAHSRNGPELIRKGSRIAGRLNTHWYLVHVERPGEDAGTLSVPTLRRLSDAFELAQSLGAEVVRLRDRDIARALLRFARENGVKWIALGRSHRPVWLQRILGSTPTRILQHADGLDVQVISVGPSDRQPARP